MGPPVVWLDCLQMHGGSENNRNWPKVSTRHSFNVPQLMICVLVCLLGHTRVNLPPMQLVDWILVIAESKLEASSEPASHESKPPGRRKLDGWFEAFNNQFTDQFRVVRPPSPEELLLGHDALHSCLGLFP